MSLDFGIPRIPTAARGAETSSGKAVVEQLLRNLRHNRMMVATCGPDEWRYELEQVYNSSYVHTCVYNCIYIYIYIVYIYCICNSLYVHICIHLCCIFIHVSIYLLIFVFMIYLFIYILYCQPRVNRPWLINWGGCLKIVIVCF